MENSVLIELGKQKLTLVKCGQSTVSYPIASANNGHGQQRGSLCTPLGRHKIRAFIGQNVQPHTVFIGRRPTGEIWTPELDRRYPKRDWILSRILWLSGCEVGLNRLGAVDTMRRFIYIHGAPDHLVAGSANSLGCIRMRNADIIALFEQVTRDTLVLIIK